MPSISRSIPTGAALRILDDSLAGFAFDFTPIGDSTAVTYERAFFPLALRGSAASVATLAENDSLQTIAWVNGIHTNLRGAEDGETRLAALVKAANLGSRYRVTHWYNPTLSIQIQAWPSAEVLCSGVWERGSSFSHTLRRAFAAAACVGKVLVRTAIELDMTEAAIQRAQIESGRFQALGRPGFVDTLARRIKQHHDGNRDVIIVAHSQGNMMVKQAIDRLPLIGDAPVNSTQTCTALLGLAPPISRSSIALVDRYVRMMRVPGDILDWMEYTDTSIDAYPTDRSAELAARLQQPAPGAIGTITWHEFLKASHGLGIHESNHNYFVYPANRAAVMSHLSYLSSTCLANP